MENENEIKPFGGYVRAWALHDMSASLNKASAKALFSAECPLAIPAMFTGQIAHDFLRRWPNGSFMRSWWIVSIKPDKDCWLVETLNTRYCLSGPGRVTSRVPVIYDIEVGKTLAMLDPSRELNPEEENLGVLVSPSRKASLGPVLALSKAINARNRV